jgi:hypothetical protein
MQGQIKRWIMTYWMISLWSLTFMIPIFTAYSNCWYWSLWKRITKGGKMIPIASKRWSGHHWIWQDPDGVLWEYTLKDLPPFSAWWELYVYKGFVRKFRTFKVKK